MKKLLCILSVVFATTMFFSCEEEGQDKIESFATELTVAPETVEEVAGKDVADLTFNVTANGVWGVTTADKWITLDPITGTGNGTVTAKIADNLDAEGNLDIPREGTITFVGDKDVKVEITIAQAGDALKLIQTLPFEATFEEGQGMFTIENIKLDEALTYVWNASSYGSDFYMKASGYKESARDAEAWLITPTLNMTTVKNAYLEFEHAGKFFGNPVEEGTVAVREINGEAAGNWVGLEILNHVTNSDYTFVNSGQISLDEFAGKTIQVGFCYKSSTKAAGTWEIKSVTVKEGSAHNEEPVAKLVTIDGITEPGLYKVENATVLATYARGFLAGDSTGKILVYKESEVVVGDVVTLEGQTSEYAGLPQFGGATEVTKTSTTTVERGEPVAMDAAALEAYVENPTIQYVTYTGVLTISEDGKYYNVAFEDTNKVQGSLSYPTQDLSAFNGKEIVVTGYTIGCSSGKFVNTMVVEVAEPVKVETNFGEKTYEFLKAVVDGKLLGDATPEIEDWSAVTVEFPGITMAEVEGKLEVTRIWGTPFTALPNTINLPELTDFSCNGNANLNGKTLPTTWNTPKLVYANFAWCHMTGNIPEGLASTTPKLVQLFLDNNDFSGAWPHIWASGVNGGTGELEVVIANNGNGGMGYMVPATLDVALNAWKDASNWEAGHDNTQSDKVQLKIGDSEKYIGFEKGWGQERYVKYGNGAADDKATWSDKRLVTSDTPGSHTIIPASIPTAMYDWDQAAADAFTASGVLPENPGADNSVTIASITEEGEYEVKATVVALATKGVILGDETGYMYYFIDAAPSFVVGDIVKVKGEVTEYNGVLQFGKTATAEKIDHNDSYTQPTAEEMTATTLDAYVAAPNTYKYISVTGLVDGNKLYVEGTDSYFYLGYFSDQTALANLKDHSVTFVGYIGGAKGVSVTMYPVSYTDNGLAVEPEVGGEITEYGTYVWTMAKGDIAAGQLVKGEPKITWTSTDAPYIGWDSNNGRGVQIGSSSKPANSFVMSTEAVKVNIKEIIVNASTASGGNGTLTVKVGDKVCLDGQALTTTATDYNVAVGATGNVEISLSATAKAMYIKSITIVTAEGEPAKPKVQMGEGTKAFLKAIVDGNLLGDSTPTVEDWDYFAAEFPGITIADVNGKLEVTRIWGAPFTSLPAAIELPELTDFSCNGNANLNGKTLPTTWNTPKLVYANFAWCHMTGNIPAGLGSTTPKLVQLFLDNNDFTGAWPHIWASGVNGGTGELEVVIANNGNNMGYMIPATFDVALNAWNDDSNWDAGHTNTQNDKVQLKVSDSGKYVGFEKGWGQQRYVKYGNGAANDTATWNDKRLVTSDTPGSHTIIPASIPHVMYDWDQAAADAYTASGVLPDLSEPETPAATDYTMTLGAVSTTEGETTTWAPTSNISGLPTSWKNDGDVTWTATDDSGKDTITFSGSIYYRTADECVWYFNKKNNPTTVSASGFGKVKKVTVTLQSSRLPDLVLCKDKEGNDVAATETAKTKTITWEFANATDGFTLTSNNHTEDTDYWNDVKISKVVIEYAK